MKLREKILMECKNQNIELLKMLKSAKICDSNYYKEFLAIWKPRIAATLGVNEVEFFKGFENEIKISRPLKTKADYADKKESLIAIMKERWLTIAEIRALTGTNAKEATAMISGIRYRCIVEMKPLPGQKRSKMYHIIADIDKRKDNTKPIPVSKAPKTMHRTDALSYVIHNFPTNQFATSKDSIDFLKRNGKEIYILNEDGGYKWL